MDTSDDEATTADADGPDGPDGPAGSAGGPLTADEAGPGPSVSYDLFECTKCGTVVLGVHTAATDLSCHGEAMQPIHEEGIEHAEPDLTQLLLDVYELPQMTINVCHFVFEVGMASIDETAEHFGYDRSTVSRYLLELAKAGFLERHALNREEGGQIYVYKAKPIDETRRAELISFLHWAGKAAMILDEANEIKAECVDREVGLDQIFWEAYEAQRTL